jgi:hypothetical protein
LLAESYDETILENILRGQEGTSPMPCKLRAYFEAIKFVIFLVECHRAPVDIEKGKGVFKISERTLEISNGLYETMRKYWGELLKH